ncbi:MAG: family 1 glycosylhydrolase, partial [Povalibacter sp.]
MLSVNLEGRRVEIWGGVECTINRVHDHYRSQLQASGHDRRVSDLDLFAQLGLARLRYPVLWEQVAPVSLEQPDWRWTDERLARLRELNIEPIAGLLHHGSGPAYTNLLDAQFPSLFARYAQMVAQRYPWIRCYTPINEPLTTARFSCLYGHWYPHQRNDRALARALLNETVATVRAMECIRQVNPEAQLIQTDDLGETFSTPLLRYQSDFYNERRWLSWDLLCGKVNRHHPLRSYLEESGIGSSELDWLLDHPCVPSMIGINHYVTSDRMLHEDRGRFARHTHGGNGRHRYADIEAVRVLPDYE